MPLWPRVTLATAVLACVAVSAHANDERLVGMMAQAVQKCWSVPQGPPMRIAVTVRFKPDGSVDGKPELKDKVAPEAQAYAASAIRAVLRCQPYAALVDSGIDHAQWREMTLVFSGP